MRGIFAAGVLDFFLDSGIRFDNVIGVSAGACHGCSFVCGQKGRAYATATDYLDRKEYCSLQSLRKTGDLFGIQHDVGIFTLPDRRRYVISMFTGDLADDAEGIQAVAQVSKLVYEALK